MLVRNLTNFPFGSKVTSRRPPQPEMTFVVRGRFRIVPGGTVELDVDPDHDPLLPDLATQGSLSMETYGEDDDVLTGAPLWPNDLADFKLRGEVMVVGPCFSPGGRPVQRTTAGVTLAGVKKRLDVVGHRVWSDRQLGAQLSDPLPFTEMPVDYRHAFGGAGFAANPAGLGMEGNRLPNLENPGSPMRAPSDRPAPAALGPLNPEWAQRRAARGKNYGQDWAKNRAPFYADDFDWQHFQCAPRDQQIDGYFRGDEELGLEHLHRDHPRLTTKLPGLRVRVFVERDQAEPAEIPMNLDTVLVDSDASVVYLTWRGLAAVRTVDLHDVVGALVAAEPLDARTPASDYIGQLQDYLANPLAISGFDVEALQAEQQAGMERLAAMKQAMAEIGQGGDAALGSELAQLVDVATGEKDEERSRALVDATEELAKQRAEHDADGPSLAATIAERQAVAHRADPAPLKLPSAEGMPAVPRPELVAALDDAHQQAESAEAELAEGLEGSGQERPDAPEGADAAALKKLIDSPLVAGLRGPPPKPPEPGSDLRQQDYRERDLRGADMSACNLSEALLTRADLRGVSLREADLSHAVLHGANLEGADLSGAKLPLANLTEANAAGAKLAGAQVERTLFDDANLEGADLTGMKASFTIFTRTTFRGADLGRADLSECIFDGADLERATAKEAQIRKCLFKEAKLSGAAFDGARLDKTSFFGSELVGARFVGAVGQGVVFLKATIDDGDFSRAILPGAFFNEGSAHRAVFERAHLKGARFYRTLITSARLARANLYDADFRHARLDDTSFEHANLFQADLSGASGERTTFDNANLTRCKLPS